MNTQEKYQPKPTPKLEAELQRGANLAQDMVNHVVDIMGAAGTTIPVVHKGREYLVIVTEKIDHAIREANIKRMVDGEIVKYFLQNGANEIDRLRTINSRQADKLAVLDIFAGLTGVIAGLQHNPNSCATPDIASVMRREVEKIDEKILPGWEKDNNQQGEQSTRQD